MAFAATFAGMDGYVSDRKAGAEEGHGAGGRVRKTVGQQIQEFIGANNPKAGG